MEIHVKISPCSSDSCHLTNPLHPHAPSPQPPPILSTSAFSQVPFVFYCGAEGPSLHTPLPPISSLLSPNTHFLFPVGVALSEGGRGERPYTSAFLVAASVHFISGPRSLQQRGKQTDTRVQRQTNTAVAVTLPVKAPRSSQHQHSFLENTISWA